MNAIDILGDLLGKKAGGGPGGLPDILKDILKPGKRPEPRTRPETHRPADSAPDPRAPRDIASDARDLEDMLNVSPERAAPRRSPVSEQPAAPSRRTPGDARGSTDRPVAPVPSREPRWPSSTPREHPSENEQALVLARAMMNAAKADGQISSAEQQRILDHFGSDSPDAIRFLRDELSKPLDVREFAWSVPLGMEQQVYAISLIAIDVDSGAESDYLQDLAHGLRLPAEVCEQLRQRFVASRRN
ncbi:MAG: DUF533 domain-containing protein [Planctomycetaceae bacterium]|nr:DUF533 domain-containing protein [Planctomycetaceae bacterium]